MTTRKADPLKALSDPLRISLFELIKEGPKTTPELAEILNKDRMELYHHLKILERSGLITSAYNSHRMKEYRAQSSQPQIEHQEQATFILPQENDTQSVGAIVLSPPMNKEAYREFRALMQEAAVLCGTHLDKDVEILQVQVTTEDKSISETKYRMLSRVKRSRSSTSNNQ